VSSRGLCEGLSPTCWVDASEGIVCDVVLMSRATTAAASRLRSLIRTRAGGAKDSGSKQTGKDRLMGRLRFD
jgi:hypothetical protein